MSCNAVAPVKLCDSIGFFASVPETGPVNPLREARLAFERSHAGMDLTMLSLCCSGQ